MTNIENKTAYPYITEFKKEPFESFVLINKKKIGSFHIINYQKIINLYNQRAESLLRDSNLNLEHIYWFLLLGKYVKEDVIELKSEIYNFIKSCEVNIIEKDQIGFISNPRSENVPDIWSMYYALSSLYILGLLEEYFTLKGKNDTIRKIKNSLYDHKKDDIFLHCLNKNCEIHKKPFSSKTCYYVLEILSLLDTDVRLFKEQFRSYLSNRKKLPSMIFKFLALKYLDLEFEVKDKELQYYHQFQTHDGGFSFLNDEGEIDDSLWIIYTFNNYSWLMDYNPVRIYSFLNKKIQELFDINDLNNLALFTSLSKLIILLSFIWKKLIGEIERVVFKEIENNDFVNVDKLKNIFGLTHGLEEIVLYLNLSYNFNLKILDNFIEFNSFTRNLSEGLQIIAKEIMTQLRESSVICLSDIYKNYKLRYDLEPLKIKEDIIPLINRMKELKFFEGNIRTKSRFLRKSKYYFYLDFLLDKVVIADMEINTEKLFEEKEKLTDIRNDIYNITLSLKNISIQIREEIESYLILNEIDYAKQRLKFILRNALMEADFLNENIENSFSQDMKYINIQAVLALEINNWKKAYSIMQKKLNQVDKYLKEKIEEKEELKKFDLILDELENRIYEIGEFTKKELDSFSRFFRETLESGYSDEKYHLINEKFRKISNNVKKYDQIIYKVSQQITVKDEELYKKHKRIIEKWVKLKEELDSIFNRYGEGFNFFNLITEKIEKTKEEITIKTLSIKERTKAKVSSREFQDAFKIIKTDSEIILNQKMEDIKLIREEVKEQIKSRQKLYLLYKYLQEKLDNLEESIINQVAEQVHTLKDKVIQERNKTKIDEFDDYISNQIQEFKNKLNINKNKLSESKGLKIEDIVNGFDKILLDFNDKNQQYLKKLNDLRAVVKNIEKNSIKIIQWEKFQEYITNEIQILKENYVNQVIKNEIDVWTKEKKTNKVDIKRLAKQVDLKCKAVIPIIKEMIEFSKIEGILDEDKKSVVIHNEAYYKNKELNTFIDTKLLKLHQEKVGKILALYDSSVRNKNLAINLIELQNRILEYSNLENEIWSNYTEKVKELSIDEEREENIITKKELENFIQNGNSAIQKIKKNLKFFKKFHNYLSEEYSTLRVDFINDFIKSFENFNNFESHIDALDVFESKKDVFNSKIKGMEERIIEKLNNALNENPNFKRLETELREFYVLNKNEFINFYEAKLDKFLEEINLMKDELYRSELLEVINRMKIRLSQLLGTLQTKVEDYIEYKEFRRAHIKVQKREKKIELEIRDVFKDVKQLIKEYEKKSKNFQAKNKYLIEDFEQFIKGFYDLLTEKVKSLDEIIIASYVEMAIKAVANQYLTIGFLQNELKIKKQKIQEHLISLISSEKLIGKYNPQIGVYYENPEVLDKLDESELEVMKKMNFRLYMFWKRLRSFASQNYSIFTFLAAILSITLSLFNFTGPGIFIILIIFIIFLGLFLLIKHRKQNKV